MKPSHMNNHSCKKKPT